MGKLGNNPKESKLESRVGKWCAENDILYVKFTPRGDVGWPDRILIYPNGKQVWLELKRKGQKLRGIQQWRLDELTNRNVVALWGDDYETIVGKLGVYL